MWYPGAGPNPFDVQPEKKTETCVGGAQLGENSFNCSCRYHKLTPLVVQSAS